MESESSQRHRQGPRAATRRTALLAIAAAFAIVLAAASGSPSRALAAEKAQVYVFNAELSLTGDCSISTLDPVPDPDCPGGAHPPSGGFLLPRGAAVDDYGDRYVASYGENAEGSEGRIDVFSPAGAFITEVAVVGPVSIAVDSEGNLYVHEHNHEAVNRISRYQPSTYRPEAGEIEYRVTPATVSSGGEGDGNLAVNHDNGYVYFLNSGVVQVFKSAAEGNEVVETFNVGGQENQRGFAISVDANHQRLYVSATTTVVTTSGKYVFPAVVHIFNLLPPHELLGEIDGSQTPEGRFLSGIFTFGLAADEETGDLFVGDLAGKTKHVYEFAEDGSLLATLEHEFKTAGEVQQLAVDNGRHSPRRNMLFVPTGEGSPGHSLAFEPKPPPKSPAVESLTVSGVTEDEAVIGATVNPGAAETSYRIEYTAQPEFGATGAMVAGEGAVESGTEGVAVSADAASLTPGASYLVRVVAKNVAGDVERETEFSTFAPLDRSVGCTNDVLRTGASAALPDCRAYELVTPGNTDGHVPQGVGHLGWYFESVQAAPDGDAVSFMVEGGVIPGYESTGGLAGDTYMARRGVDGWSTVATGPTGVQSPDFLPGSASADQGYSVWQTNGGEGTMELEGEHTSYVRYPDGSSKLLGRGSLGVDPAAIPWFISPGGGHIVFESSARIEPGAPAAGTAAIYDRTGDEITHVVSLLPGDMTPASGEGAELVGVSGNGRGVAFRVGPAGASLSDRPIDLRVGDSRTVVAAPAGATFAGLDADGTRLFYMSAGDLYAFDAESETVVRFTTSEDVTPVNIAAGGAVAYFVSPSVLQVEPGPGGAVPQAGAENLYLSQEGAIGFVGTVAEEDVLGELDSEGGEAKREYGLGMWTEAVGGRAELAVDPSRSTADGGVLVFQSRAALTGYDPEGHVEIYRYDAAGNSLICVSCSPTGAAASGAASLETAGFRIGGEPPFSPHAAMANVSLDGGRIVFQSTEGLASADTDGVQDIYEWERDGAGSCRTALGCVYLISSGTSAAPNYLYGVGESGSDVFFRSSDVLLPAVDPDDSPSIYDARVDGGFPAPAASAGECLGEACQPTVTASLGVAPASASFEGLGNVTNKQRTRCERKRLARRNSRDHMHRARHERRRHGRPVRHGRSVSRRARCGSRPHRVKADHRRRRRRRGHAHGRAG